jgi:hypothetical protein
LKQLNHSENTGDEEFASLESLIKSSDLSVRGYNVARGLELTDTFQLVEYYQKFGNFLRARNCGQLTNLELIGIAEDFRKRYSAIIRQKETFFSQTDISLPSALLKMWLDQLSVRSRNSILGYLNNDLNNRDGWLDMFDEEFSFIDLYGCGQKAAKELERFFSNLKNEVLRFNSISSADREWYIFFQQLKFRYYLESVRAEDYNPLSILDLLLTEGNLYTKNERIVLQIGTAVFKTQPSKNEAIASLIGLTRERTRQLQHGVIDKLLGFLDFVSRNQPKGVSIPSIQDEFVFIDEAFADQLNDQYQVHFSSFFYCLYFSRTQPQYGVLGQVEDVLLNQGIGHSNRHDWKSIYLVPRRLQINGLSQIIENVYQLTKDKRKETISVPLIEILPNKFKYLDRKDNFHRFMRHVLLGEFDLELTLSGAIVFQSNSRRKMVEYYHDSLKEIGVWASAEVIVSKVNELFPEMDCTTGSVRNAIVRDDRFMFKGRSGLYGLKEWEARSDTYRGGTIREFALEYLVDRNKPVHYEEVTNYVKKFRPKTSQKSVIQNLKISESDEFVFFKGYVAVKGADLSGLDPKIRNYKSSPKSWNERFRELQLYCEREKRLPSSNSDSHNTRALHAWLYRQKNCDDIPELKKRAIQNLLNSYKFVRKRTVVKDWDEKYEELRKFCNSNKRFPDSKSTNRSERSLHGWYVQQTKKLKKSDLRYVRLVTLKWTVK